MKKVFVLAIAGALVVSSCGTYTGQGAYVGSTLGSILGSAIGGISDGPRGSDWGSILGMAGGAVVGAAVGSAADKAQEQRIQQKREEIQDRIAQREYDNGRYDYQQNYDTNVYDPNHGGDDRVDLNIGGVPGSASRSSRTAAAVPGSLEIRNVRFFDDSRDNALRAGEVGRIVFEVVNRSQHTIYDVRPVVIETQGNKQVYISPEARVEQIGPGKGIRYTAMVKGGRRLKNGVANFRVLALQGNDNRAVSNTQELRVRTSR